MENNEFDPFVFLAVTAGFLVVLGITSAGENRKWIFLTFGIVAIVVTVLRFLAKSKKKNTHTSSEKPDLSAEKTENFGTGQANASTKNIPSVYNDRNTPVPPNAVNMSDLPSQSAAALYNLPPDVTALNDAQPQRINPSEATSMPRFLHYGAPTSYENMPESAFSRGTVENSNTLCDAIVPPEVNIPDTPVRPVINHRCDLTTAEKSAPDELVVENAPPAAVKHENRGSTAAVSTDTSSDNTDDWLTY